MAKATIFDGKMVGLMRTSIFFSLLLLSTFSHPCVGREVASAAPPPADSHLGRRLHGADVHRTFFCDLEGVPIIQVVMNETIGKVHEYQINNNDTATAQQTYAVKACDCYYGLLNSTSYCPADSNYCHISVAYNTEYRQVTSRKELHDPTVACFRDTQLKSFARSIFNYWTIVTAFMIVFLIWSGTGRVSANHCFASLR